MAATKDKNRDKRMKWWREARFGMFVHWGLYSQLGRHEWAMNRERIPLEEYTPLADTFKPKPNAARDWARLAKRAGMKYMVMTTKHHEGYCLWDSKLTDYCAAKTGPDRDLVGEYVEACREFGLKVGLYYSLVDWHHPDGARCYTNQAARRRFLDYTHGLVQELMTNYGQIDILWYDVPWPFPTAEGWESGKLNRMVRKLQPQIIINNRSHEEQDFSTPEGHVNPSNGGRDWEACMTFNGAWGYSPPATHWRPVHEIIEMLNTCAANQGNLLLNIGPAPDGSVPPEGIERLQTIGRWTKKYGEALYGATDPLGSANPIADSLEWFAMGGWSLKKNVAYLWVFGWRGAKITLGGFQTKVERVSFLHNDKPIEFTQIDKRLALREMPRKSPDKVAGVTIIKIECKGKPRQKLGYGNVLLKGV